VGRCVVFFWGGLFGCFGVCVGVCWVGMLRGVCGVWGVFGGWGFCLFGFVDVCTTSLLGIFSSRVLWYVVGVLGVLVGFCDLVGGWFRDIDCGRFGGFVCGWWLCWVVGVWLFVVGGVVSYIVVFHVLALLVGCYCFLSPSLFVCGFVLLWGRLFFCVVCWFCCCLLLFRGVFACCEFCFTGVLVCGFLWGLCVTLFGFG